MLGEDGLETLSFRREKGHKMPELVTGTHQQNYEKQQLSSLLENSKTAFHFPFTILTYSTRTET